MADEFDTETETKTAKRGPSVLLLLSGIVALVVSAWALAGGNAWPFDGVDGLNFGWILAVAAIVAGALLVFVPGKRARQ
ncbi:hypothetical protein OG921_20045 [Aldersonia sp. NBC_00410]|uniref:hypothetical protein n=1 Tax=Aldersonia sp. NBC_00410 TaxID=2975954 RepID=UPI0022597CD5|nr:hypothetical protein [Aldersonia sp. NBC_00410]MCX5045465.1 hypothetical protein [Aldersonia sp. NBC_00410]